MKKSTYHQIGLPPLSLIGNPLFVPDINSMLVFDIKNSRLEQISYPVLEFHKTQDYLWRSFHLECDDSTCKLPTKIMREGSLVKLTKEVEKKTFFGGTEVQANYEIASMEDLLKEGLLIKTDYETAFSNLGIFGYYQNEIAMINKCQNVVYQVPHEKFERDGAVTLLNVDSNRIRGKPVKDALKELLDNLLPQPVATPQRR